jgi:hypothetical protein
MSVSTTDTPLSADTRPPGQETAIPRGTIFAMVIYRSKIN